MRTCVLRVHLTSLTLILVITVSGQEGVSRDDTGGYILHCSRSLITPVLLARTLLVRYFIMCSYVTGSFFVLLLSLRTENEMLWCVALTGWDRDVEEVKITFIHSAFPPPRVYSPLILAFCCPTLEAAWHLWYACSRWHRSGRVESGFLRTNADKWTDN